VQIYGIKYGLRGFYSRDAKPMELNAAAVEGIHLQGGTVLVRAQSAIERYTPRSSPLVLCLSEWFT
jgi:6-phosphofructokinase